MFQPKYNNWMNIIKYSLKDWTTNWIFECRGEALRWLSCTKKQLYYNYNEELFQFDAYITAIANNVIHFFLKAIVQIMHQVTKMCVLVYEMYVRRIFIIETHFQKLLCTEKARNFREVFGRNRPYPKVRLECDFLSFLIFEDI